MTDFDLKARFAELRTFNEAEVEFYDDVKGVLQRAAEYINETLPSGRERSKAIAYIEDAVVWIERAISRTGLNS